MPQFILIVGLIVMLPNTAYAYLDPGTGSAIVQGLIAAIALVSVTAKVYWHRILVFFGRATPDTDEQQDSVSSDTESSEPTNQGN